MKVQLLNLLDEGWSTIGRNANPTSPFEDRAQYTLQAEATKLYLDSETAWSSFASISSNTAAEHVPVIVFRKKPSVRAESWVKSLLSSEGGGAKDKDVLFQTRFALQESHFAESFIEQGGLAALLQMISKTKGNAQTYALHALRQCMEYVSGMTIVMGTPHLVSELFTLVDSSVVGVRRTALELLFVMCGYAKVSGFHSVHRAAKSVAKTSGKSPYQNVIHLLESGQDLETMLNAFTLLNVLLMTCPTEGKAEKLFTRWDRLGLHDRLRQLTDIQHSQFQVQLEIYEETTGVNLRTRASRLEAQVQQLRAKLAEYEQQQACSALMRDELRNLMIFMREASQDNQFISSAPVRRYLGSNHQQFPTDLSFLRVAEIEKEKVKDLNASNASLTSQLNNRTLAHTKAEEQITQMQAQLDSLQNIQVQLSNLQEQFSLAQSAHLEAMTAANAQRETLAASLTEERNERTALKATYEQMIRELSIERDHLSMQQVVPSADVPFSPPIVLPPPVAEPNILQELTPLLNVEVVLAENAALICDTPVLAEPADLSTLAQLPPLLPIEDNCSLPPSIAPDVAVIPMPPSLAPPPPPAPVKSIKPNKPPVSPAVKMKPLYWKRLILPQITRPQCIWDEIVEPNFETTDLEALFGMKPKEKKEEVPQLEDKVKLVAVLDVKKSQAISFMVVKLPPIDSLKQAILHGDLRVLNKEILKNMLASLPSAEEVQVIRDLSQANLDKPERFVLQIFQIPKLREMLRIMLLQHEFTEASQTLNSCLKSILDSCTVCTSNQHLKKALGVVLCVGNYLNGGTTRGQADGFTLEVLDALASLRDNSNTSSLLNFIAQVCYARFGLKVLRELASELELLAATSSEHSFEKLSEELSILRRNTTQARSLLESALPELPADNHFVLSFPSTLRAEEGTLEALEGQHKKARSQYSSMLDYFGYTRTTAADVTPGQIFGWLYGFTQGLMKICSKLEEQTVASSKPAADSKVFGKKIAQGQDPLAALANAIKLGNQLVLRKKNSQQNLTE